MGKISIISNISSKKHAGAPFCVIDYKKNCKIENDKILMTHNDQTGECEYKDGKITLTADGTTMILSQEKEE